MFLSPSRMYATTNAYMSTYTFYAGILMLLRSIAKELIPQSFKSYFIAIFHRFFPPPSSHKLSLIIDDIKYNYFYEENEIYEAAEIYLNTKINNPQIKRLQVSKTANQKNMSISIEKSEVIIDSFEEIDLTWKFIEKEIEDLGESKRYYELSFNKQFEEQVISSYLPYVLDRAYAIKMEHKIINLFSIDMSEESSYCGSSSWEQTVFKHPATFDTLGIDPEVKKMIMNDLCRFLRRKELYNNVGKPWKRGYLLYGPPGTGKSSLIAAMANYLHFDIYYLQLSLIQKDSQLEKLLFQIPNRSMLVVEDINCNFEAIGDTTSKLSLIGVLSFSDGIWSSALNERIIVMTTNYKERLDPTLLRPGRMDMHIHVSFCTPEGFKFMVSKYFGSEGNDHYLCKKIEELIESVEVTPGEIAGKLLRDEDIDVTLQELVKFLEDKQIQNNSREIFLARDGQRNQLTF